MTETDQQMDRSMGLLLQAGVFSAAAVMIVGGFIYLFIAPPPLADYGHFHPNGESLRSIPRIIRLAFHGNPAALIEVGALMMIATPVARVVFAIVLFARERDKLYVAISAIVLVLLLYSLLLGN